MEEEVMMKKANKTPMVVQSNKLIEARYRLSLGEQRLILAMISMIGRDDTDFKDYVIRLADFWRYLGTSNKNQYSETKKITKRLLQRVLEIKTEKGGLLQCNWISSAEYIPGAGIVRLSFDPKLKPYLLFLKEEFTRYGLTVIRFKSVYSIRIYGLLKQYEAIGRRKIAVSELRAILGLENTEYQFYKDLKRRVLTVAQKELKKGADVRFEFTEIKKGKKVDVIEFTIQRQPYQQGFSFEYPMSEDKHLEAGEDPEKQKVIKDLSQYGMMESDTVSAIEAHGIKGVREIQDKVLKDIERRRKGKNPVQDVGAYMATCLRQGFGRKTPQEQLEDDEKRKKDKTELWTEALKARLDNINKAVGKARKERFVHLKEGLPDREEQRLRDEFVAAVENGIHGEAVRNAYHVRGWNAPGLEPLFAIFLKNRLLPSELEDCRAQAASNGENYDALVEELKSVEV